MSAIQILGINAVVMVVYMLALWAASLVIKDASLADSFWGLGFVVAAVVYFLFTEGYSGRKILILALVAIWGLAHSLYHFNRRTGRGEDPRYQALRAKRPRSFWWFSLLRIFLLQAVLLWVISIPLFAAQYSAEPVRLVAWDIVGIVLWLLGFGLEALGGARLAGFEADPESGGRVADSGVRRYLQRPSGWGGAMVWWAFYLMAVAAGGWWTFFSPLLVTILALRPYGAGLSGGALPEERNSAA